MAVTYRDVESPRPPSRSIFRVCLAGPPRDAQRIIAFARILAAVVALFAFFAPWHVVHSLQGGGDASCWASACKADATAFAYDLGYTCNGWSHSNTILPIVALATLLGFSFVPFRRPRMSLAFGVSLAAVVACIALAYALFDFEHVFDRVEVALLGKRVFDGAMRVVMVSIVVDILTTPLLYAWARKRLV